MHRSGSRAGFHLKSVASVTENKAEVIKIGGRATGGPEGV